MNHASSAGRFSGWRVVGVLALAQMCGIGLLQVYSLLVDPLQREFAIGAADIGAGMSIFIVVLTGVGPILGPLVDRGHVRSVMLTGVVLMVAGVVWVAEADSAAALIPAMALTSLGMAMSGPIPANTCVTHWFLARRGTAIALVAAGGAAGFGLPPLSAWLIETEGWRTALRVIAIGSGAIALPVLAFGLIARPERVGQHVDGIAPESRPGHDPSGADAPPPALRVGQWLATRDFWLLSVGVALVFCVPVGMGPYLVPYLAEQGIAPQRAALAVSLAAVFGFAGTLLGGILADRAPPKRVFLVLVGALALAYAILGTWPGFATALIAAAVLGIGAGGVGPFLPLFAAHRFGPTIVGRVMGAQGLVGLPMLAAAPIVAGYVHDVTGHYEPAFLGAAASLALPAVLIALFRLRPAAI